MGYRPMVIFWVFWFLVRGEGGLDCGMGGGWRWFLYYGGVGGVLKLLIRALVVY